MRKTRAPLLGTKGALELTLGLQKAAQLGQAVDLRWLYII